MSETTNIKVVVRVRPAPSTAAAAAAAAASAAAPSTDDDGASSFAVAGPAIAVDDASGTISLIRDKRKGTLDFRFTHVMGPDGKELAEVKVR